MSFRAPLLRATARLPHSTLVSRPLTTLPARPIASALRSGNPLFARRSLNTSQVVNLESTRALGDGGQEEAPHSGINVDKSTRMDA
ncbi:hypothetical protein IAU60_002159 [Kwoniella sp. DSM 27419]